MNQLSVELLDRYLPVGQLTGQCGHLSFGLVEPQQRLTVVLFYLYCPHYIHKHQRYLSPSFSVQLSSFRLLVGGRSQILTAPSSSETLLLW